MSFLTPLFLLGLAGLAVPVIIHLIQRERKNVVQFPSLMFLQRIPYQSVQRRRIRNWPLLLLRLAALALIVAAFARPFLRRPALAAAAAGGAREVVVLIDRSYSMGYGDRWARATAAARDAIDHVGPADRASVVFFASGADVALRSTPDRSRLNAAVSTGKPGAGATRYGPPLKLAGTNVSTTFAMPYFYAEQTNRYTVTVFDQQGNRSAATTTIYPRATLNRSPQPFLTALPMVAGLGQDIVFDASSTFDPEHGVNLLEFEWDFDGDGIYDTEPSTDLVVTNNYYTLGSREVFSDRGKEQSGALQEPWPGLLPQGGVWHRCCLQ